MLMPGRQFGQGENFPGVLVNGTTTVNGYTLPIDLNLTSRGAGDAAEYVASNSVEFGGEFESGATDEFFAYIADNAYAGSGNMVSGGGAYGTAGRYRYGFNGQEMSNEIKGVGNSYTAEFWEYDPRIGRRWNLDPRPTVGLSEYSAFNGNPIFNSDPLGDTTVPGAGLLRNLWTGAKDGLGETGKAIMSLGTKERWKSIGQAISDRYTQPELTLLQERAANIEATDNVSKYVINIPNMSRDQIGHDLGYGFEKIGEAVVISKGVGLAQKGFTATAAMSDMSPLFHTVSKAGAAENILSNGINPAFFNSASRFGKGFYLSNSIPTTLAELSFHGGTPVSTLQFTLRSGRFLNATSPVMGFGVRYAPRLLSTTARALRFDGIMYRSLRGPGTNLVQFRNFNLLENGTILR